MNRRPIAVTLISLLLIATGVLGFVFRVGLTPDRTFQPDLIGIAAVELAAVVCGVFMLRASNWARWLSIVWIGFHVALSLFHSRFELAVHVLVFAAFAYFLFRPRTNDYFRGAAA